MYTDKVLCYSLRIIGEPRESGLREAIKVTVQYIKTVAAHLSRHHQTLDGTVGADGAIGADERAECPRGGVHSEGWIGSAQRQIGHIFSSIIAF